MAAAAADPGKREAPEAATGARLRAPKGFAPSEAVFAVLCFEGPDPYALAGGLGSRVTGLTAALAAAGAETHLYFVGDPAAPGIERRAGGRLVLHRWCQWISRYYPRGVYDGEEAKLYDFNESVPADLLRSVARPAAEAGRRLFVLAEDWQTAEVLCRCSDLLHAEGLRAGATLLWNANNPMGFERINWGRLGFVASLTTVSRFMKHSMWRLGCNPLVIANGIPEEATVPPPEVEVAAVQAALRRHGGPAFVKVGRWDPDKRWLMAVHAVAQLRAAGVAARLVAKGGIEPHQAEVFAAAAGLGLRVADVTAPASGSAADLAQALAAAGEAEVLNLRGFLPTALLQVLYAAGDAVLANSGMEPFGLVGLEAMGAGALVFTGCTGEDYARPLQNAVVLETDDAGEIARYWRQLESAPELSARLRRNARATAAEYTWPAVLEVLFHRLDYLASAGRG